MTTTGKEPKTNFFKNKKKGKISYNSDLSFKIRPSKRGVVKVLHKSNKRPRYSNVKSNLNSLKTGNYKFYKSIEEEDPGDVTHKF